MWQWGVCSVAMHLPCVLLCCRRWMAGCVIARAVSWSVQCRTSAPSFRSWSHPPMLPTCVLALLLLTVADHPQKMSDPLENVMPCAQSTRTLWTDITLNVVRCWSLPLSMPCGVSVIGAVETGTLQPKSSCCIYTPSIWNKTLHFGAWEEWVQR